MSAIVLFAHGARDPEWAQPFEKIRQHLQQTLPATTVAIAYLECMQPTLDEAISNLSAQGIHHITLIPMFLARGGHLKKDLPALLANIQQQHTELTLHISPAIGEVEDVLCSLAQWIGTEFQKNKTH